MGGFTAVCAMPNTHPPNDNSRITRYILKKAAQANFARVYPVGAISEGLEGKRPCEFGELKAGGAIAVSDEGNPVMDDELMRKAGWRHSGCKIQRGTRHSRNGAGPYFGA
jgi:dihydroorotase